LTAKSPASDAALSDEKRLATQETSGCKGASLERAAQ